MHELIPLNQKDFILEYGKYVKERAQKQHLLRAMKNQQLKDMLLEEGKG